jgi:hypothetical protein
MVVLGRHRTLLRVSGNRLLKLTGEGRRGGHGEKYGGS